MVIIESGVFDIVHHSINGIAYLEWFLFEFGLLTFFVDIEREKLLPDLVGEWLFASADGLDVDDFVFGGSGSWGIGDGRDEILFAGHFFQGNGASSEFGSGGLFVHIQDLFLIGAQFEEGLFAILDYFFQFLQVLSLAAIGQVGRG